MVIRGIMPAAFMVFSPRSTRSGVREGSLPGRAGGFGGVVLHVSFNEAGSFVTIKPADIG